MDHLIALAEVTIQSYCTYRNIDLKDFTDERAKDFLTKWIRKREKGTKPLHPAMVKKLIYAITTVLDRELRPIPISMRNQLKRTATAIGADIYKKRLVVIKKAIPYSITTIMPIITALWNDTKTLAKQAATVLAINYATGARTGETLTLKWEDVRTKTTAAGKFVQVFVRAGKCNKLPSKNELLTALVSEDAAINVTDWLNRWRPFAPHPKTGKSHYGTKLPTRNHSPLRRYIPYNRKSGHQQDDIPLECNGQETEPTSTPGRPQWPKLPCL